MSYTQRDEEPAILAACANAERTRFLDIGAFDPIVMSNTRALYEAGWTGVLIEPSPKCVRALVMEYGHQQNIGMSVISAAVGLDSELITILITDDAVSAENPKLGWILKGGYIGKMLVHAITIPQILSRFGAFDFVSIDTEGTSVDLLKVLLATEMFPRCICCEYDDRLAEAQMAAHARGYKVVHTTTENVIFSL